MYCDHQAILKHVISRTEGPADGKTETSVPGTHTVVTGRCRKDNQNYHPCIQADRDHTKNTYDKYAAQPQQKQNDKLWQIKEFSIV